MTTHNTEPIPIQDALMLCDMAIEDCDNATQGPWEHSEERVYGVCDFDYSDDGAFIVLSRAVMRPMLEFFKFGPWPRTEVHPTDSMYEFLAALRDYYDATRPDWRSK